MHKKDQYSKMELNELKPLLSSETVNLFEKYNDYQQKTAFCMILRGCPVNFVHQKIEIDSQIEEIINEREPLLRALEIKQRRVEEAFRPLLSKKAKARTNVWFDYIEPYHDCIDYDMEDEEKEEDDL
jgi:hypothetical protein